MEWVGFRFQIDSRCHNAIATCQLDVESLPLLRHQLLLLLVEVVDERLVLYLVDHYGFSLTVDQVTHKHRLIVR